MNINTQWILKLSCLVIILFPTVLSAQQKWTSTKYGYVVEIPENFNHKKATSESVDFSVVDAVGSSIMVNVKALPADFEDISIDEMIGDTAEFRKDFLSGGYEYFENLQLVKYTWTTFSNYRAFFLEQTAGNPKVNTRMYQFIISKRLYVVSFGCADKDKEKYGPIWFRFKENAKF